MIGEGVLRILERAMALRIASGMLGALVGLGVGCLAWTGLAFFDHELPRVGYYAFALLGAAFGGSVGFRGGPAARWSGGLAVLTGGMGFMAGVFGLLMFERNSPQAPLFAVFVTGPYGAILGALVGLMIGIFRERRFSVRAVPSTGTRSRQRKALRRGKRKRKR